MAIRELFRQGGVAPEGASEGGGKLFWDVAASNIKKKNGGGGKGAES